MMVVETGHIDPLLPDKIP